MWICVLGCEAVFFFYSGFCQKGMKSTGIVIDRENLWYPKYSIEAKIPLTTAVFKQLETCHQKSTKVPNGIRGNGSLSWMPKE